MVGATPAAAAAIVNGCCILMATNPTQASIEKLVAASKNPELINHTNIRNVWNH